MKNYEEVRKKAMTASAVPEGWGRSVVGGKEILTAPSQAATATTLAAPIDDEDDRMSYRDANGRLSDEESSKYSGPQFDDQPDMIPDLNGWIGDYHKDDLLEQWKDLEANHNMIQLNDLINEASARPDDEDAQFLSKSIRFGRLSK